MNILVLNGSPKGETSVTIQYVKYLAKMNPKTSFQIVNICPQIRKIERDAAAFESILAQVRQADGVLWAFPLYFLIVHAHYLRFIELVFERGAQSAFAGKYAASLSTSIHFFDHTAHNFMHGICDDLQMRYIGAFSPYMTDLLEEKGRKQLEQFGRQFLSAIQDQVPTQRQYPALQPRAFTYQPGAAPTPLDAAGKKVVLVHDGAARPGSNLPQMVARMRANFAGEVLGIDLTELEIKSSCLGCLKCGAYNECAFEGKDDFIAFYREQVMAADILIFAGSVGNRYLSSRWKTLFDRSFFNTHTPVLVGKQLVYLLSGPFSQVANLREILQAHAEFQMANLVGFVSDEYGDSGEIDRLIDGAAQQALAAALAGITRPMTFLGVGGLKIFRDDVWGPLRPIFQADHRAFARLGFYRTFPQQNLRTQLLNALALPILSIRKVWKGFSQRIPEQMIVPLQRVVEKAQPPES